MNTVGVTGSKHAIMKPRARALLLSSLALSSFTPAFADDPAKQLVWWQVVTGVLAIPAALLGMLYSYHLIRKTRLEARKLELDIREKEKDLKLDSPRPQEVALQGRSERLVALSLMLAIGVIAIYIALFTGTVLLPITRETGVAAIAITIPAVAAQVMLFVLSRRQDQRRPTLRVIPVWVMAIPLTSVGWFAFVVVRMVTIESVFTPSSQTLWFSVSVCATMITVANVYVHAGGTRIKRRRKRYMANDSYSETQSADRLTSR